MATRKSSAGQQKSPKGKSSSGQQKAAGPTFKRDAELENRIENRSSWRGRDVPKLREYLVQMAKGISKQAAIDVNPDLITLDDLESWTAEYERRGTLQKDHQFERVPGMRKRGRKSANEKELEELKARNIALQKKLMQIQGEDPSEKVQEYMHDNFLAEALNRLAEYENASLEDLYVEIQSTLE